MHAKCGLKRLPWEWSPKIGTTVLLIWHNFNTGNNKPSNDYKPSNDDYKPSNESLHKHVYFFVCSPYQHMECENLKASMEIFLPVNF